MSHENSDNNRNSDSRSTEWKYEEEYIPPWLPALILFPPLAPFFWKYHVRVGDKMLTLGYSHYFHEEIERSSIEKAEVIEHINGLTQFGGWGYRKSLDMKWITGYITKNGPGVRLTYKDKKNDKETTIIFNCDDAERVCQILNTPVVNAVVH